MRLILLSLILLINTSLIAQSNFWSTANESAIILNAENDRGMVPSQYHTFSLDLDGMKSYLQNAPMKNTTEALEHPLKFTLPLPDGEIHQFKIHESPVMEPGIAAKYDHIRSFSGYSTENTEIKVRFVYSDLGLHAMFYTPTARYYIQPYAKNVLDSYIVFDKKDQVLPDDFHFSCGVENDAEFLSSISPIEGMDINENAQQNTATERSTTAEVVEVLEYKMAIAGVAEWTNIHGGTVSGGMSAANVVLNLLNSVFEPESAVRFVMIDNNDTLIYTDAASDPYLNVTDGGGLLQQNQTNLDIKIGNANYDIGHVMTIGCANGLGGIAGGTVCSPNGKGRGVTCQGSSNLEYIILEIAAHEIGHQFTASHTWDNCPGILDQRASGTAFEPGSGSTILSYSGSCGANNVQGNSDTYFHVGSLQQIWNHTHVGGGADCPDVIPTTNNKPELALPYEDDFYIPISTPFELTAIASDIDGDNITYCWEQYNIGPLSELGTPTGTAPSFRSYPPNPDPTRVFPRLQNIVQNNMQNVEVLPTYTRNLTFRCTVRDNILEKGGVVWDEMSFEATAQAGPFRVQYPNTNEILEVGQYIEALWDVANTDVAPVNCEIVNIKFSSDGGYTYPITLAENVPNDGAHFVTIPNVVTGGARIRVEAADNIFFDISNFNFQVIQPSEPGYAFSVGPFNQQVCAPDDVVIDLSTISLLDYDSLVTFSIDGLPAGANPVFSANPSPASVGATLNIETAGITQNGEYNLQITAIAPGADTLVRDVNFELVISDFSMVAPLEPANGSSAVSELPTFTWDGSPFAESYDIEIADNPSFAPGSILEIATGVTETSYTPTVLLEKNTLYFWRLRAKNICGDGAFSIPQGFHTEVFVCSDFESSNVPLNISEVGTPVVESTLVVNTEGVINDLNIRKIKGSHDLVQHLDVSLVSPDAVEVLLFSGICGVATQFNLGLDDEAASEIQCPPNTGATYQPEGTLADFNNTTSTGIWTLKVAVNNTDGFGGSLESWSIELCSNASANPPYLVNNELMPVPPGQGRQILSEFLLSEDDDNGPEDLTYTVVTVPENGTLFFLNTPLEVGMTFRQATINAGNLSYVHDGGPEVTDGFTFAVEDGEGGWFGTPLFEIEIDPDVVISTEDLEFKNTFTVFPNPAQNQLSLKFDSPLNGELEVFITNVQGQIIQSQVFENTFEQVHLNTARLSNGIYFINVKNENGSATEKFVIQK